MEPALFDVGNREKVVGTLLSYDMSNDQYVVDVYNSYSNTLPNGVVLFAFDPAGILLCFDYEKHKKNAWEKEMLLKKEGLTEEQAEERARENNRKGMRGEYVEWS